MENIFAAFVVVTLVWSYVASQSIDEIIVGSYESVDEIDELADLEGNVRRRELDMLVTREQDEALRVLSDTEDEHDDHEHLRKRRKAIRALNYRWPQKTIPYSINRNTFSDADQSVIMAAIEDWTTYTCIRFRQANRNDENKVHFDDGKGCYSYVGMINTGSQKIGLAKGCRFKGVIIHEIGHAVGFHHEQNRPDRDDYVRILTDNIHKPVRYNFKKYPSSAVDNMGVPYDYTSIMHYGGHAFSKNGQLTIKTIKPEFQNKIGNREGLSFNDIMLANKMYKCSEGCDQSVQCPSGAFLGKDCECWCPGYPVRKCESTGTVPTTTLGPSKTTKAACRNENKNCPHWAEAGYCSRNTYVRTYCKEACGFCKAGGTDTTTKSPCKDLRKSCQYWKDKGYCEGRFEYFMSENCPKSCKVCGTVNENPGGDNSVGRVRASLLCGIIYLVYVTVSRVL